MREKVVNWRRWKWWMVSVSCGQNQNKALSCSGVNACTARQKSFLSISFLQVSFEKKK